MKTKGGDFEARPAVWTWAIANYSTRYSSLIRQVSHGAEQCTHESSSRQYRSMTSIPTLRQNQLLCQWCPWLQRPSSNLKRLQIQIIQCNARCRIESVASLFQLNKFNRLTSSASQRSTTLLLAVPVHRHVLCRSPLDCVLRTGN